MTISLAVQVQYGNTSDALTTNKTHASVRITLTMHYPQPEMAPSEQAAVANIYSQCVSLSHLPNAPVPRHLPDSDISEIGFCC